MIKERIPLIGTNPLRHITIEYDPEERRKWRDEYVKVFFAKVPEGIEIPDATPYDYFPAFGLLPEGGICFNKPQVAENRLRMAAMNRQKPEEVSDAE